MGGGGWGERVGGGMRVTGVPGAGRVRGRNRAVVVRFGCVGYGDTVTRFLTINE